MGFRTRMARWLVKAAATSPLAYFGLASGRPTAGVKVDPYSAMRTSAVYACVRVVSEDVAKLPLLIYRVDKKGGRTIAKDHPLYRLLAHRPNGWQSAFEWKEMMQAHIELRGNSYSFIERDAGGRVIALIPIHPDRVSVWVQDDGLPLYKVSPTVAGYKVPLEVRAGDMLHLRGQSMDGYIGLSPIAWLRESIGITLAVDQYAGAYFGNGARPDFAIKANTQKLTAEQVAKIRDEWDTTYRGAEKAHRPAVLPGDMDVVSLGLNNKDSQFIELRQFQVADLGRAFRIPLHKIGSLDKATFSNIEQQALEYFQDGLMPRLERFEAALSRDLLTDQEVDQYEIEFDFAEIIRGDIESTLKAIALGRNWGILDTNESRDWLGLDPVNSGDGDRLLPLNMMPAAMVGQDTIPADRKTLAKLLDVIQAPGATLDLTSEDAKSAAAEFLRSTITNQRTEA